MAEDLAVFGIQPDQAEQIQSDARPREFEVFEENWEAVMVFLKAQTQWRVAPIDGVIGLDYSALRWLFELHPPDDPAALLADVQVMEVAALKAMQPKEGKRHGT